MTRCPSCSDEIPDGGLFCGRCGAQIASTEAPTQTSVGTGSVARPSATPSTTSPHGRFLPGTVVAERYRIVGLLGRGGMGEVYRADDLILDQPVALKFLPQGFERDPDRLERFLGEIRAARQITHPNVCRVHDVGQVDGQHYLSMEYVDGEDLSGLLRRIGRLPSDKATDIARQLAAGIAAAHDQGILHRDLKPANVMLDGRGRVRITDFGLAGLAGSFEGVEVRVGTPAYMAPEQLAGREVTARSDIYSLGLVLYELYTGKKPFEGSSMAELQRLQLETTPTSLTNHVEGLDPAVEGVVLRCLDRDPANRPRSALAVSAALPGGDPLAAALAAGETPSPEMVANAGEAGGLAPRVALALLLAAIVSIALTPTWVQKGAVHRRTPFDRPPEELRVAGVRMLEDLGYDDLPRFKSSGFREDSDLLDNIAALDGSVDRWDRLDSGDPPPILFWQRRSPAPLWPDQTHGSFIRRSIPQRGARDTMLIELDTQGRLVALEVMPPVRRRAPPGTAPADWVKLLRHAGYEGAAGGPAGDVSPEPLPVGLVSARFQSAEIEKTPPVPTTELVAWEVETPGDLTAERTLIQAGAFDGLPTYFEILYPWDRRELAAEDEDSRTWADVFFGLFLLAVLGVVLLMAANNLRRGRGDRQGAFRMAVILGVATFFGTLLPMLRLENLKVRMVIEITFGQVLTHALIHGALVWVVYIALEPYARRLWPQVLVSWSRMMVGRLRDPMVGRDVLIGCATLFAQIVAMASLELYFRAADWPRGKEFISILGNAPNLGVRENFAWVFAEVSQAVVNTLGILAIILVLRLLFRRSWIAIAIFTAMVVVLLLNSLLVGGEPIMVILLLALMAVTVIGLPIFLMMRYGLLAAITLMFFRNFVLGAVLTVDPTAWYAPGAFVVYAVALAIVGHAFWVSLAGRAVFSDMLE